MKSWKDREEAFLSFAPSERLKQTSDSLRRISDLARQPESTGLLEALLDEARGRLEWTAPYVDPRDGEELANLQQTMTSWLGILRESAVTPRLRGLLFHEMWVWHYRLLDFAERAESSEPPKAQSMAMG